MNIELKNTKLMNDIKNNFNTEEAELALRIIKLYENYEQVDFTKIKEIASDVASRIEVKYEDK